MEGKDKRDVDAEVVLQVSQENSQPTESDSDQAIVVSTVSATVPFPANNLTYCSYDYQILKNIECEHELPEHMHEDSVAVHSVNGRIVSGLQNVKCEKQELNERRAILPFMNTDKTSACTYDVNELTEVKLETKADPDEYDRNSDVTRHWIVCQGGVLKEVKAEHTLDVSDTLAVEDGSHNVDQKQCNSSTNNSTMKCQLMVLDRTDTCVNSFTCDTCGKSLVKSAGVLNVLERTHASMKPYTCNICRNIQTGVKPFTCDTCGKSFATRGSLVEHQRIHTGVKPFTCETCGKSFAQSSSRTVHERLHTGVKPFSCETCGKSFNYSGHLKVHERIHTGVKLFTCVTCGKSFARRSALTRHERRHTGVKPFTCETCGTSFVDSGHLKVHERIHTGVKPYTCDTCRKSFARRCTLLKHERTHTGVRPYTCDRCGKSFAHSSSLKVHGKIHKR